MDWNPEFSRRARGLGVYATIRALGREGVAALVDRNCHLAPRFAAELAGGGRAEVANDVVFNQVLVSWLPPDGSDPDRFNDAVVAAVYRRLACRGPHLRRRWLRSPRASLDPPRAAAPRC